MTRAILIKLSVILNTFYACENVKHIEGHHKMSFHQQGFHSNNELSNVITEISDKDGMKISTFVDNKVSQQNKLKRSVTEGLLAQPMTTR